MAILSTLKDRLVKVLQIEPGDVSALEPLILTAFNNARRKAELQHDFVYSQGVGYLTVAVPAGALLSSAQASLSSGVPSGATVSFKSVYMVRNLYEGKWGFAKLITAKEFNTMQERTIRKVGRYFDHNDDSFIRSNYYTVYQVGPRVFLPYPDARVIELTGYIWLPEYASFDAPDDFLLERGQEYIFWETILSVNFYTGSYIPRNEGSFDLASVTSRRDEAWQALLLWDSYLVAQPTDILT